MAARKNRTLVVVDTNVFIAAFLTKRALSPNKSVIEAIGTSRELQLVVSNEIVDEYMGEFELTGRISLESCAKWRGWFTTNRRCTLVTTGPRPKLSRDPDDNIFLATALAGRADFLITNDRDLLDLPRAFQAALPFAIVTPRAFLKLHADRAG